MNKLIVNHIEKHFFTSDCATILKELEVQHPAAKMLCLAAAMQEQEFGDGSNIVLLLGAELLIKAENLIQKVGVHLNDIHKGYQIAMKIIEEKFSTCEVWSMTTCEKESLAKALHSALCSKVSGCGPRLAKLVASAAEMSMPSSPSLFDTDNIRVLQVEGGNVSDAQVIQGMVMKSKPRGCIKSKVKCRVAVMGAGLSMTGTETSSQLIIKNASELENFAIGEEQAMETLIKGIHDSGVGVVISSGAISDLAQHFCDKYEILTLKTSSKWEIKRLSRALGATPLARIGVPIPEEMGYAEAVKEQELASTRLTVIESSDSHVSTIVLRGSTNIVMDEMERSIADAIGCLKSFTKNRGAVAGGGAAQIRLSALLKEEALKTPGLERYGLEAFAEALEVVPRNLASSAGMKPHEVVAQLYIDHSKGEKSNGINIQDKATMTGDTAAAGVLDHAETQKSAIRLAADAACTLLKVDEIVMAKPAGGPKFPNQGHWDEDEKE
eukprot:GHVP01009792.1.p1 GENE.GHVP01009792.1~~GHVP01009792.1.p1  ORF type:complete len:496 (-),score=109.21 GHVP01009792.1:2147-3634(-)